MKNKNNNDLEGLMKKLGFTPLGEPVTMRIKKKVWHQALDEEGFDQKIESVITALRIKSISKLQAKKSIRSVLEAVEKKYLEIIKNR